MTIDEMRRLIKDYDTAQARVRSARRIHDAVHEKAEASLCIRYSGAGTYEGRDTYVSVPVPGDMAVILAEQLLEHYLAIVSSYEEGGE